MPESGFYEVTGGLMEGYSDHWEETNLPDGSTDKRNVKKVLLLSRSEGAGSPSAKRRAAEGSSLSGRTTLGQQHCTQCTVQREPMEDITHVSTEQINGQT